MGLEALDSLEQNLQELLVRYKALQAENAALQARVEGLSQDLMESHAEQKALQTECNRLRLANSLAGSAETRTEAYQRLTQMIAQVDKAIELMRNS